MTTTGRTTVVGVFTDQGMAEHALEELHRTGFTNEQVGFIAPRHHKALAGETDTASGTTPIVGVVPLAGTFGTSTPAPTGPGGIPPIAAAPDTSATYDDLESDDTTTGATSGAVGGGVLGGILGAAAALLIPGFGPAIAGGILAATLGGAAIGALAGGLIGALTHLGIPEEEARYYQNELSAGKTLVTVHTPDRYADALAILHANGAFTRAEGQTVAANRNPTVSDINQAEETMYTLPEDAGIANSAEVATTDTTTPDPDQVNTSVSSAQTARAVNATTPYTTTGPQASYDPELGTPELPSESVQRTPGAAREEDFPAHGRTVKPMVEPDNRSYPETAIVDDLNP